MSKPMKIHVGLAAILMALATCVVNAQNRMECDYSGPIDTPGGTYSCSSSIYVPSSTGLPPAGDSGEVGAFLGKGDVNATPTPIGDVLTNPGMGLADFHFGWWCNLPPVTFPPEQCADRAASHLPAGYVQPGTAYFRWLWKDIEPVRGAIDFAMIDNAIQSASLLGETLGFRIEAVAEGATGIPDWMMQPPYCVYGEWRDGTFLPDYRDEVFQTELQRLMNALGARYNGHPGVDHVDIGIVGCWGEWNTACFSSAESFCDIFQPATEADYQALQSSFQGVIDAHINAFPDTPVVALGGSHGFLNDLMVYAVEHGSGWRVDCWGDWGIWGSAWNHMEDLYPPMIANATAIYLGFGEIWRRSPIQLEVCGTMPSWHDDFGWTADPPDGNVYKTFQWSLEQHASVLNAKRTEIPSAYRTELGNLLRLNGYRLVLERLNHRGSIHAGGVLTFYARWENAGTTPMYIRRLLFYRLRNGASQTVFESGADVRDWVPGKRDVEDTVTVPADLAPGVYSVDVAVLNEPGSVPEIALPPIALGMAGRMADGWYPVSQLTILPAFTDPPAGMRIQR
jgi:hypothetical protein